MRVNDLLDDVHELELGAEGPRKQARVPESERGMLGEVNRQQDLVKHACSQLNPPALRMQPVSGGAPPVRLLFNAHR